MKYLRNLSGITFIVLILILTTIFANLNAQTKEYQIQSVLIWKIIPYLEWPNQNDSISETNPFIISVIGQNPFGNILELSARKRKLKNREVKINYVEDIESIGNCQVLFISRFEKNKICQILSKAENKPILIISDAPNCCQKGVHINFYLEKNRIKFKLNLDTLNSAGFEVDFRLRNIAEVFSENSEEINESP